jgi:putative endonuclease
VSFRSTREKGSSGEALARDFLRAKGYRILDVNFQTRMGEIDIIARDRKIVVFVEVKFSTGGVFGSPLEWVPPWKQLRIIRVSQAYLAKNRLHDAQVRYDVVAVDPARRVFHVEDAFRPAGEFPV